MANRKTLQPTEYAKHRYNITEPLDFKLAVDYSVILMAIAGADGELSAAEIQWYIDEQKLLVVDSEEYIEAIRNADWKNINIKEALEAFLAESQLPLNARLGILYQAIKMCRADNEYHKDEKAAIDKAAQILGVKREVVTALESTAELEETTDRLRLSLLGAGV